MTATIKKIRRRPGEGCDISFYAEYPVFSPNEDLYQPDSTDTGAKKPKKRRVRVPSHEKLNQSVERFIAAAQEPGHGADSVKITHHIYLCSDSFISFSLDVHRIKENSLVYIRRFCFNWDCKSAVLLPLSAITRSHRKLKAKNGGSGDYTISPGTLYMHRNTFTPEAGRNCRRSQYKKFLSAEPYELDTLQSSKKLRRGVPAVFPEVATGVSQ